MSYIGNENERIRASRTTFTATGGETTASVTYTVGQLSVYMNGIKLLEGTSYPLNSNSGTVTHGSLVSLRGDGAVEKTSTIVTNESVTDPVRSIYFRFPLEV